MTRQRPAASPVRRLGGPSVIGARLADRYGVVSEVAQGAFGVVCHADDTLTRERVALRLLPPTLPADAVRASVQAMAAVSMSHPAFVRVLDQGVTGDGRPFVVMELAEGRCLSETLAAREPLALGAALQLALEIGGAVEVLHRQGIAHGALRPDNVRIRWDGLVKLMDLELAGLRRLPGLERDVADATPAEYLVPEQIRRGALTPASDVYAFGVLLHELVHGVPPFEGDTRQDVVDKHLRAAPPRPSRWRRSLPATVEAVVAQCLQKEPEQRPALADVLARLATGSLDAAPPVPPVPRARRLVAAVVVLLVATAVAIPVARRWDRVVEGWERLLTVVAELTTTIPVIAPEARPAREVAPEPARAPAPVVPVEPEPQTVREEAPEPPVLPERPPVVSTVPEAAPPPPLPAAPAPPLSLPPRPTPRAVTPPPQAVAPPLPPARPVAPRPPRSMSSAPVLPPETPLEEQALSTPPSAPRPARPPSSLPPARPSRAPARPPVAGTEDDPAAVIDWLFRNPGARTE